MKHMLLVKVIQENECRLLIRTDVYISVVFAMTRLPELSLFEHKLSTILSITLFRYKYMNCQLQIITKTRLFK